MKKCHGCKESYDESMFHKNKNNSDKLDHYCKNCKKSLRKTIYENNKTKENNRHKKYMDEYKTKLKITPPEQQCYKCKVIKPSPKFGKDNRTKNGIRRVCKECRKIESKLYNIKYKDQISKRNKNRRKDKVFLEKEALRGKEFRLKNKDILRIKNTDRVRKRMSTDLQFKIMKLCRSRVKSAIKSANTTKCAHTIKLIGCTSKFLVAWLELTAMAQDYINFDINNYDGEEYNIDHYIPIDAFDLTDPEQQFECFNWRNMRMFKAYDNQVKSNKSPVVVPFPLDNLIFEF
jgi:hypothetical protein